MIDSILFLSLQHVFKGLHSLGLEKIQIFRHGIIGINSIFKQLYPLLTSKTNPLPYMLILGSSKSASNKDMISKIRTNGDTVI